MTREEITQVVLEELENIAPDADLTSLDPTDDLRESIDLDSMDLLNLLTALHERLNVEIPDAEAGQLVTLAGAADYLSARLSR